MIALIALMVISVTAIITIGMTITSIAHKRMEHAQHMRDRELQGAREAHQQYMELAASQKDRSPLEIETARDLAAADKSRAETERLKAEKGLHAAQRDLRYTR